MGESLEHIGGTLIWGRGYNFFFFCYMAEPGFQKGIAEEMKIDQSTVSKTLKYESEKIMAILKFWIGTYALVNELLKILPHPNLHWLQILQILHPNLFWILKSLLTNVKLDDILSTVNKW